MSPALRHPALLPNQELVNHRRRTLTYCRALGAGAGVFLLLWSSFSLVHWLNVPLLFVWVESWYYVIYGGLLVFPYGKIRSGRLWRLAFGVLALASLVFMFLLVFDVMFIANAEAELNQKTPPPILNSALVFIGLLQVPVVLFSRHPEWLD